MNIARPQRIKPIIGKTFGQLTALRIDHQDYRGIIYYEFKCSCGNIKILPGAWVRSGNTKSCGCLHAKITKKMFFKGVGELGSTYFTHCKNHAKARNLQWKITIQNAWNQFIKQNKKCAISGVELTFPTNSTLRGTASLDRIDSTKGYTTDNIQWVHKDVNMMKQDRSDEGFIKWCQIIADFSRGKTISSPTPQISEIPIPLV